MILTESPRRKLVTRLVNWGHWFALLNIILAIIIASVYVFTTPVPNTLLGNLYLFSNWFSHMGFLTFVGFIIAILPLCYLLPNANWVKGIGSVLAAIGLALLAFDALLYNKYGLHLTLSSADLIKSETQTVVAQFGWQQWGFLLLLFIVWLFFQLVVANAIWKRIDRLQRYKLAMPITSFFVLCFVASHALHVWADATLYQPIVQQDDMFPLSYPATAKTLMSKHGLLDLQNYEQRKALQFDYSIRDVQYPVKPVYCGVDKQKSVLLLISNEPIDPQMAALSELAKHEQHYMLSSNYQSMVNSTLFGLPELYQQSLQNQLPIMLDLPAKLGLPVALYSEQPLELQGLQQYTTAWQTFKHAVRQDNGKLAVGFVNNTRLKELLNESVVKNQNVLVTHVAESAEQPVDLYTSNSIAENTLSSNEDFAPTILKLLGCAAAPDNYSTGQDLHSVRRRWIVGTTGNRVVVLYNNHRIEVASNGNYKIFDRKTGEQVATPLNTGLLSQAMKHLSQFYK